MTSTNHSPNRNKSLRKLLVGNFQRAVTVLAIISLVAVWHLEEMMLFPQSSKTTTTTTTTEVNLYSEYLGVSLEGGVLPIRRFTVTQGTLIQKIKGNDTSVEQCNRQCLRDVPSCTAWEFRAHQKKCLLFTSKQDAILSIHQSDNQDPSYIVGFPQKYATVLEPAARQRRIDKKEKVLYILHFHHDVWLDAFARIMNQILPSSWLDDLMDIVVIAPREVDLTLVTGIFASGDSNNQLVQSLVNPFRAKSSSSLRGANGYMSLPIAKTKFPGYKGYALVNDDAMIKLWKLDSNKWFGPKPWVTFTPFQYRKRSYEEVKNRKRIWIWWKCDSGSACEKKRLTVNNFNTTLNAMNELCLPQSGFLKTMERSRIEEFCTSRPSDVLNPFTHGKADLLYVPNNKLGKILFKAIALFGEHDSFMEIGWPTLVSVLVPANQALEMPTCDQGFGSNDTHLHFTDFFPPSNATAALFKDTPCPTIHRLKFSKNVALEYWRDIVESDCLWCTWKEDGNEDAHWKLPRG